MPLIIMLKILLQLEPGAHFSALKRSWRKVIFLHLSVILFTGGISVQGGPCPRESLSRGSPSLGGLCLGGSVRKTPTCTMKERGVRILLECILVIYQSVRCDQDQV